MFPNIRFLKSQRSLHKLRRVQNSQFRKMHVILAQETSILQYSIFHLCNISLKSMAKSQFTKCFHIYDFQILSFVVSSIQDIYLFIPLFIFFIYFIFYYLFIYLVVSHKNTLKRQLYNKQLHNNQTIKQSYRQLQHYDKGRCCIQQTIILNNVQSSLSAIAFSKKTAEKLEKMENLLKTNNDK